MIFYFLFLCIFPWSFFFPFYISMRSKIVIELWHIHNYANIQAMANMVVETFWHEFMETKKLETKKKQENYTHQKYKTFCNYINKQVIHHPTSKHLWQFLFLEKLMSFQKVSLLWSKGKICAPSLENFPNNLLMFWQLWNCFVSPHYHQYFYFFVHNIDTVIVKPLMFHGINSIPN